MARDKITELAQRLRDAARQQDPYALAVIDLMKLSVDRAKDGLVTAEGDGILRVQGEARGFAKLLRELTTVPPSMQQAAGDN